MILLGNLVWEGLSTEEFPTTEDGAKDGQFLKQLDTGESFTRKAGEWENINLGLSFIKATKSGNITTGEDGTASIEFNTPFIDNNYSLLFGCKDNGVETPVKAAYVDKTVSGFTMIARDTKKGDPISGIEVAWLATRDYNP